MKTPISSLNLVRAFEAAARNGSLTRAAEELLVQQPAVSRQVKELESQLNTKLFRRRPHGLELTPDGLALYKVASASLSTLYRALEDLNKANSDSTLTVNTSLGFANLWLLPRLHRFRKRHPKILVDIRTRDGDKDASTEHADIRVSFGVPPARTPPDRIVFREEMVAVARPDFLPPSGFLALRDLARQPLLHIATEKHQNDWADFLGDLAPLLNRPEPQNTFHSFTVYMHALQGGSGIGIGWLNLMDGVLASNALVRVSERCVATERAYFCETSRPEAPHIRAFMQWLCAEGRRDDTSGDPA